MANNNPPVKRATRNSLSCAQCRYKHLRCDGRKPTCTRCATETKQCTWPLSRRRGHQKRNTGALATPVPEFFVNAAISSSGDLSQRSNSSPSSNAVNSTSGTPDGINSQLLSHYYEYFHDAHPCVLPFHILKQQITATALQPLLRVMCFIGSVYDGPGTSEGWKQHAEDAITGIREHSSSITGFDVQAVLLYAIAVYWCNEPDRGADLLDEAIRMAVALGMNRKEFAKTQAAGDSLLEESWRRTWWMIYATDAHIAGSTHTYPFRTSGIEMTTELPCEEEQYLKGDIPQPRSLEDYENREFLGEDDAGFSSFAELVGLTLGVDRALAKPNTSDYQKYAAIVSDCDTSIWGWYSLLPPAKRAMMRADGSVDEVMFKAIFIMHTYTVEIHRPLSGLAYSAIEPVSHCAPRPPSDQLKCNNVMERNIHTAKCTKAIDSIDELLTLPTNLKTHSPFIICMMANLVIAHLSACRFVYIGEKRSRSREKIRLTMGTLKLMSEHWAFAKRTYREIGVIARELLSLAQDTPATAAEVNMSLMDLPSIDFTTLGILPETDFDFCAFFDSETPNLSEPIC